MHQYSKYFPRILVDPIVLTSAVTTDYNCIAWAYGVSNLWFWPAGYFYWPTGIPREETITAFIKLFESIGYSVCATHELEDGIEKVAIYALNNIPTHAARQLPDGTWTSKLGQGHDILHNITNLNGHFYGEPVIFLSRNRAV
jgi:hypothetical protein